MKYTLRGILSLQMLLCICSCKAVKPGNAANSSNQPGNEVGITRQPMVVSYILRVTREDTNSYDAKFEVMNRVRAAGTVKLFNLQQNCDRCLYVRLLDKNKKVVEEQRLYDPLYEEIEYLVNDSSYNQAIVKPTDKTIMIRTNSTAELKQMQFRFSQAPTARWIKLNL